MVFAQAVKLARPISLGPKSSSLDSVLGAHLDDSNNDCDDTLQVSWICGYDTMACPLAQQLVEIYFWENKCINALQWPALWWAMDLWTESILANVQTCQPSTSNIWSSGEVAVDSSIYVPWRWRPWKVAEGYIGNKLPTTTCLERAFVQESHALQCLSRRTICLQWRWGIVGKLARSSWGRHEVPLWWWPGGHCYYSTVFAMCSGIDSCLCVCVCWWCWSCCQKIACVPRTQSFLAGETSWWFLTKGICGLCWGEGRLAMAKSFGGNVCFQCFYTWCKNHSMTFNWLHAENESSFSEENVTNWPQGLPRDECASIAIHRSGP